VIATDDRFENIVDENDGWFSDIELKVLDLEKEISQWRESRARQLAEPGFGPEAGEPAPGHTAAFRRAEGTSGRRHREFLRATGHPEQARSHGRTSAGRTRPSPADRTRTLIDRGRRPARRSRWRRGGKIAIGSAAGLVVLVIGAMIVFRNGPSWPASVATVQSEITIACQNPNVAAEPGQVNFACGKDTSQVLWVFALLTSNDTPGYANVKTGRKGLEPITPVQGGEIAWSLNLHHPYDPLNPVDSLEVAARAINNIVGGATLTGASGKPAVQPGLESKPENCARYTGSPTIISRAGFPSLCASPVTSPEGQAALVADVYQQWMPGATPVAAQNASVLFQNANNAGDPQVQAILKTLPGTAG
jgi:hypothetical protein